MIYADVIYKRQFDTFLNENIIAEYYQNEISLLESIIDGVPPPIYIVSI